MSQNHESLENLLQEDRRFPPSADFAAKANAQLEIYERAEKDRLAFWELQASDLEWSKKWDSVLDWQPPYAKWFIGGKLNASVNALDRHVAQGRGNRVAFYFEGEPGDTRTITYAQLLIEVKKTANALIEIGLTAGDRVAIYMPMIPEAAIAMLACARIGAPHSVVFGGFSADALLSRIQDADAKLVITADGGFRKGAPFALKPAVDEALKGAHNVEKVLVVARTKQETAWSDRDIWWHDIVDRQSSEHAAESFDSEHPLFILYTSGTTAKPKGIFHTTGGYLTQVAYTHKVVFDIKAESDIYWCTADVGWVTGHTYIVYGPLANGATTLMFEGVPSWPDSSRFWRVVDKHQVNIFYTAPTAIRSLMREGTGPVEATSRKSLRILGSVGEPINPEAWLWYYKNVGDSRCPIVDTWWQTETGGILISPLPGATALKPGSATLPLPGVRPILLDAEGRILEGAADGLLCLSASWPGMMRTIFGDHDRFVQTYFSTFKGYYFTGDGAKRDADGYYWITGRVDDVINVSGHRMGTAEVESALVAHKLVAEAAVVGFPHDIKGQGIYAYVTLNAGIEPTEALRKELVAWVRKEIGPIAAPDVIQWAPGLPKTRSGKIMRRILRKIAANEIDGLGDTSTLADPAVVTDLVDNRAG